jgi:cysteine desulfurase/selenocysteine lyase
MRYLGVQSTARASFYIYTVREDIDQLIVGLHAARKIFGLG